MLQLLLQSKLQKRSHGFTLVELAIVLVIIGLVAGGVLFGREMIDQARTLKQIRSFNDIEVANHTFLLKYNGLPGDLPNAQNLLGGGTATILNGDNSGTIDPWSPWGKWGLPSTTTSYYFMMLSNEMAQFYVHLAEAGYLKNINPTGTTYIAGQDFPISVGGQMQNVGMTIFYYNGTSSSPAGIASGHYLWLGHHTAGNTINSSYLRDTGAVNWLSKTLYQMDTKIDDGRPVTGRLVAPAQLAEIAGVRPPNGSWAYNGGCANSAANTYINVNLDSYTYPYGTSDPGNCYAFYKLF